jgi:hypothetical protein
VCRRSLADSLPPHGTADVEAEYCAFLELLGRLEARRALAGAGLL